MTTTPTTTTSEPVATSVGDPLAPEPTITKSSKSTTTHRTASAARPAKAAHPVARAAAAAPVAAPVTAPAETVEAAPIPVAAVPAAPPPAAPVAAAPPAQDASILSNDLLPIAGAAGLGLLGLAGLGVALRRRKRRKEEEEFAAADQYEPALEAPAQPDPIFAETPPAADPAPADPLFAEPAFVAAAAPAVASAPAAASGSAGSPSDCIEAAPGSHVEAACDGPSADNPSLSIKKRLKRAHFFDQREQLAAAGMAVPVAADAGLPDAVEAPEPAEHTREPA
jgi:hypothetical protein